MTTSRSELNSTDKQDLEMTAKRTVFKMSYFAFLSINGPLIALNLMVNIFFVVCLMMRKTQQVKQPLKILLGSVVSFTILYLLSVTLVLCVLTWVKFSVAVTVCYLIVDFMMLGNMTSYVWLMFYYYTMIVPSQRALFLWVKKNIKSIIYVVLFFERLMFLGNSSCQIIFTYDHFRYPNGTGFRFEEIVLFSIVRMYLFLCLCVMMISCFATAHYLHKHMRSLAASDGSLFNPRLCSQIRVTVTGILQGVLYFFFALWNMVNVMSYHLSPNFFFDAYITFTVINLYISGTTVNLGVGQTLFRERAVHVWKAVRKRLGTRKSSKDLRPAGNNLTSLATIESSGVDTAMSL